MNGDLRKSDTGRFVVLPSPAKGRERSAREQQALDRAIKINKQVRESLGIKSRPKK